MVKGYFADMDLLAILLDASGRGLEAFGREDALRLPADYRLAFRELGLSIGLEAVERLSGFIERNEGAFSKERELKVRTKALKQYEAFAEAIDKFWLEPEQQRVRSWTEHQEINMVMLATCLAPDGYLML
jgi:hypothetical protein